MMHNYKTRLTEDVITEILKAYDKWLDGGLYAITSHEKMQERFKVQLYIYGHTSYTIGPWELDVFKGNIGRDRIRNQLPNFSKVIDFWDREYDYIVSVSTSMPVNPESKDIVKIYTDKIQNLLYVFDEKGIHHYPKALMPY